MAQGARLMEKTPAVNSSYEQILDRLEFLMNLQGQTKLTRQKSFEIGDIIKSLRQNATDINANRAKDSINEAGKFYNYLVWVNDDGT